MRKFFGLSRKSKKEPSQEETKEKRRQTVVSRKAELYESSNAQSKDRQVDSEQAKYRAKSNGIATVLEDGKKRENVWNSAEETPRFGNVPRPHEGEQIAAGWPPWLTAVAGEALRGWLPRRADSFEKIDKIGQGTYSNVYKARDIESGKVVALKKVRFDNLEPESVRFMAREIKILRQLDHPNVVKLEGLVTSRMSCSLYLVFEYMDHDLSGITASPNVTFTEAQVKCYMLQILRGLEHCHNRGVLHRDIKGSNLLLDKEGNLKIADFGLATFFHPEKKQQLTTRVVTLWFRPPELLLGATEYGVAIDLWSVGCILGELFAGRPILPGRTEVEQLHKIFKLCGSPSDEYWKKYKLSHATIFKPQQPYKRSLSETYKHFPQTALDLIDVLLAIEPDARGSASAALRSEFFTTQPFACDPSSLPKYISNKDSGRDARARRQRAANSKPREISATKKDGVQEIPNKSSAVQMENAGKAISNEKDLFGGQGASRSRSERFTAPKKEVVSKLQQVDGSAHNEGSKNHTYALPPKPVQPEVQASLNWAGIWDKNPKEEDFDMAKVRALSRSVRYATVSDFKSQGANGNQQASAGNLSKLSTLVATRNTSQEFLHTDASDTRQRDRTRTGRDRINNLEQLDGGEEAFRQKHPLNGLDTIDVQDAVHHERSKNKRFGGAASKMQFSGPLLPPAANVDRMLDERERQIQDAVRRARHEKGKNQHKTYVSEVQVSGTKGAGNVTKNAHPWDRYGGGVSSRLKEDPKDLDSIFKNYEDEYEMRHL